MNVGDAEDDRIFLGNSGGLDESGFGPTEDVEGEFYECFLLAEDDGVLSVESSELGFSFVIPFVNGDLAMGRVRIGVGVLDDFLEVAAIDVAFEKEGGAVPLTVAKKGEVGEVGEGVESENTLHFLNLVAVVLTDGVEDDGAAVGFTKAFEVAVQVPLGIGGDGFSLKGCC